MKSKTLFGRFFLQAVLGSAPLVFAGGGELIFSQWPDGQSTFGPSVKAAGGGANSELADDFYLVASVDRITAPGYFGSFSPTVVGAYARFYAYGADHRPGALQAEYYASAGSTNLVASADGSLDIRLPAPFQANGRHFLTVQAVTDSGWYWWGANTGAPGGQSYYFRDLAAGQTNWQSTDGQYTASTNTDLAFVVYGTVNGPGHIDTVPTNAVPRSGYLEILGQNFGGSGSVLVGGVSAPVADWTGTRIVAYVPETTLSGSANVQVVTAAGASNVKAITVVARAADGRVNWRFRMNGPYSNVRPAIGPDGTVYAVDVFQHLYALGPDGGLKWLARGAGDKGVAVGNDGTVYVASESFIKAFSSAGSNLWTFVQEPRAFICLGVAIGPEGNIYSVGTEGMGVFSLTPSGQLRWSTPEPYVRPIRDYAEIVFGPGPNGSQLYFYANHHLRALGLDGSSKFEVAGSVPQMDPAFEPAIGLNGSVHTDLAALTPTGSPLWSYATPYPLNTFTPCHVSSNGQHYFVQNLGELFSLNPNGSLRWHRTLTNYVQGPVADPQDTLLVMGGADTLDKPGSILAVNTTNGSPLWRIQLPLEDPSVYNTALSQYGFNQFVDTRGRFTADGRAVYLITATATGDNTTSKSFVYSIRAKGETNVQSSPVTLHIRASGGGSLEITWPASASGVALYRTAFLGPPVNWAPVTNTVVVQNGISSVGLQATGAREFFCLRPR